MTSIVNPVSGAVVCADADIVREGESPTWWTQRPGVVLVRLRPSVRPGLDFDLASYPSEWVVP